MVKHYIADDELDKVNVEGVKNLIDCCIKDKAKIVQISTYSVAGFIEKIQRKF